MHQPLNQRFIFAVSKNLVSTAKHKGDPMAQPVSTQVMLYMSAQNDLSNKALENIDAIKASAPLNGICAYIMMDRIKRMDIETPDARNTLQYRVPPGATPSIFDKCMDALPSDKDVSNPAVFKRILATATEHFVSFSNGIPAKQNILVFWGHGGGMVMLDELQDNGVKRARANIKDFADVLAAQALKDKTSAFDIIAFDSCYMCMIETMNDLRSAASVALCSSTMVDQDGFPYEPLIRHFVAKGHALTPAAAAKDIADIYNTHYSQLFPDGNRFLFTCDMSKIGSCADALNDLGESLGQLLTDDAAGDTVRDAISEAVLGANADSSYVYSLALLKMLAITLKRRVTAAELQNIQKKSDALKAAIASTFSGNLGDSTDKPVSPLIFVPFTLNAFDVSELDYNALDSSKNGEAGWANMWRLFHRRPKQAIVAQKMRKSTRKIGLPTTSQLAV
jgi:Clostripain family